MTNQSISSSSLGAILVSIFIVLQLCNNPIEADLACQDENGRPVDWYVGYKFPKLADDDKFQSGYAYAYLTSEDAKMKGDYDYQADDPASLNADARIFLYQFRFALEREPEFASPFKKQYQRKQSQNKQSEDNQIMTRSKLARSQRANLTWSVSDHLLTDPKSVVMRTLEVAYQKTKNNPISRVFYNDHPPWNRTKEDSKSRNVRRAHAKGVLLMDERNGSGIWLTHSVPQFPPLVDQNLRFLENSILFGQTFMCVSLNLTDSGKKIVDHLVNMRVQVYEYSISDKMYKMIPDLEDLDPETNSRSRKFEIVPKLSQMIVSKGGQVMHLFSKSTAYEEDMYAGWIDEELGSPLYVETWRRGSGTPLSSSCPKQDYHVNNVQDLKYNSSLSWRFLNDHSKWAITYEEEPGIVCIGDQNRMESQFKRGGGAICIKCPSCWSTFSNTIQDVEPCPTPPRKKVGNIHDSLIKKIESLRL